VEVVVQFKQVEVEQVDIELHFQAEQKLILKMEHHTQ
jgi:hypothetical protein